MASKTRNCSLVSLCSFDAFNISILIGCGKILNQSECSNPIYKVTTILKILTSHSQQVVVVVPNGIMDIVVS